MKIIGIDPSSSLSGVALVEYHYSSGTYKILWTKTWAKDKSKSDPENLYRYFKWLKDEALIEVQPPTLTKDDAEAGMRQWSVPVSNFACVEFLSVTRNAQTSRMVSHYQAASVLACKELGMTVVEARVSSARKEALGRAGSKDEAWDEIKKLYPHHTFKRKTSGGTDEADAVVLAMAARGLAER